MDRIKFATEGVFVSAAALCCESRYEKDSGVLKKTKRALKGATVMQSIEPTVD